MSDLAVVAASVVSYSDAVIVQGTAGVAITAGQSLCYDPVSTTWKLANAKKVPPFTTLKGVALCNAAIGQPIVVQTAGGFNPGVTVSAWTPYFTSGNNDGGIAPAGDIGIGWITSYLGMAVTTTRIQLGIEDPALALTVPLTWFDYSYAGNAGFLPVIV